MTRDLTTLRNLGIIAHIDAGKTTLTEGMLFYSGAKHRVGSVDKGTTETDSDPEEQDRGITIYSACVAFEWKASRINLLDTPGHVDFTAEVERCLRVLDGAVVVFSAREGVEAQSETVWRQADRYRVPRLAFINKLDREGASFETVVEEIDTRLGAAPVPIQIPCGEGPSHMDNSFHGVIDLVRMRQLTFDAQDKGATITESEVAEEHLDMARLWREAMLEKLYAHSDELMELALAELPIPEQLIHQVLRQATIEMQIQPLLCGSALHGIGVQPLLDAVQEYLPSPLDMPPVTGMSWGKKGGRETTEERAPEPDDPFCGLVFKVVPAKTGDLSWIRIYSGSLKANSRVLNPGRDKRDNVAQLWQIHATRREQQIDEVSCGDIVGVIGLQQSVTGDTLCDTRHPILLEAIEFPETVISMAIEPETTAERKKLESALDLLQRQDPTLSIRANEMGQTLISGMGELHLEITKHRLLRDFNLDVKFHKPQVSYRETIEQAVDVTGECHRQIGGQQLFARLVVRVEPSEHDTQPVVINQCPIDRVPIELLDAAVAELESASQGGGLIAGFPLMKLRVTILGGEFDPESSDEVAFRIAANEAFEKALRGGIPALLEPIMKLDISTPEVHLGDIVGDLQQRRAIIARTDNRGVYSAIEAHAPMNELFGYSSAIRSLSQGRAGASMEPLAYATAPAEVRREYEI